MHFLTLFCYSHFRLLKLFSPSILIPPLLEFPLASVSLVNHLGYVDLVTTGFLENRVMRDNQLINTAGYVTERILHTSLVQCSGKFDGTHRKSSSAATAARSLASSSSVACSSAAFSATSREMAARYRALSDWAATTCCCGVWCVYVGGGGGGTK